MCYLKHNLRIFLFCGNVMLSSQDIQICIFNYRMIYQICAVISISTCEGAFLNISFEPQLKSHHTWPTDRHKQGQYFSAIFWTTSWTGAKLQVLSNLATSFKYSITSYVKIPVFHFFEKVKKGQLKMVNVTN